MAWHFLPERFGRARTDEDALRLIEERQQAERAADAQRPAYRRTALWRWAPLLALVAFTALAVALRALGVT